MLKSYSNVYCIIMKIKVYEMATVVYRPKDRRLRKDWCVCRRPKQNLNIIYTVSYSNGPEKNPKGNLAKGKAVFVQEGMIFNVSRSDKS